MSKPIKSLRASEAVAPNEMGQWFVLIGDSGEISADDIEAYFAAIWPDVEPEATLQYAALSPRSSPPLVWPLIGVPTAR